jgi:hypothetical protein
VLLWLATWTIAWLAARRRGLDDGRRSALARLPLPVGAAALVVGLVAIEMETRVGGARLGVMRGATALSSDPALGMDRGPSLGTGEIVRILARRGGWTLVEASADREGWVATSQVLRLADRRVPRD